MANITDLERQILELDKADEAGGEATQWRLKNRYHREGLDTTKRDLLEKLEKESNAYGIVFHIIS
jgi:MFS superfamily sulfate permease-like transporter